MNKKIDFKNFDLKKVKLNSKGGVYVEWYDLENPNDLLTVNSESLVHEDLINKLNELKYIFAKSLGILDGWEFAREHNRKNEEALRKAIQGFEEQVSNCNVSGFVVVGNESDSIKITGSLASEIGTVGLTSPLIKFDEENLGIGIVTNEIVKEFVKEAYLFIYKQKRGADLFSELEVIDEDEIKVVPEPKRSGLNNLKAV